MPISSCWNGLLVTSIVTLLLLPAQYYVPEFVLPDTPSSEPSAARIVTAVTGDTASGGGWGAGGGAAAAVWPSKLHIAYFPTLDLVLTFSLLMVGMVTYLCEWIQRKLMERRIVKLNQYLGGSVERLRAWDAQHDQLESTLRMVQNATSEYNLLLYLLLRQHRCLSGRHAQPHSDCFFDKQIDDDLMDMFRGPTLSA